MGASRRTSSRGLADLSSRELETRDRALHAVAVMRRDGLSLKTAAKEAGADPRTVLRYAPSAFTKHGSRWRVKPTDRITRRQWTAIIGPTDTPVAGLVETKSSRMASEIGRHSADLSAVLSVRTAPEVRAEAVTRLEARHGTRAGSRALLADGTIIADPEFFGHVPELVDAYDEIGLGDLDYGSSAAIGTKR
jgi:hypothetical protein